LKDVATELNAVLFDMYSDLCKNFCALLRSLLQPREILCRKMKRFSFFFICVCFYILSSRTVVLILYFFYKNAINLGFAGLCIFTHSNESTNWMQQIITGLLLVF